MNSLDLARNLAEAGQLDESFRIISKLMEDNPNDSRLLVVASYVQWKAKRLGLAYHLGKRAVDIAPNYSAGWINLGTACDDLWLTDEAESAYRMVLRIDSADPQKAMALSNLAALYINTGRFGKAEPLALEALKLKPDSPKAEANLGFALLGQRKWTGWKHYSRALGMQSRLKVKFGEEPDWDGSPGKVVALYGEQGIGDEISFASMVPDAVKDCKRVIVETDPKLAGLFRRSFSEAKVYGTRKQKQGLNWDEEDRQIDASCAIGELGGFYRLSDESFTGEPYLKADPARRLMWRALFDSKKKPCIGVAWTGGVQWTGQKFRTLSLEQLASVLGSHDAHYVSLQYKDASAEIEAFRKSHPGIDIVQYPFATLTPDYDDTAAMVAELDMVICIQTAVAHLCGGLGKECWVLLPKHSQWRYGESGDTIPWYKSVRVFRQRSLNDWHGPLGEVTGMLRKKYRVLEAA
jgi:hypothetical protein